MLSLFTNILIQLRLPNAWNLKIIMCLEFICIFSFVNYLHMLFVLISTDVSQEEKGKLGVWKEYGT